MSSLSDDSYGTFDETEPSDLPYPPLRRPVLIAAFEGWNDAGDAATAAVEHLEDVWDATPLAAIDPEDYYDFQVNRPTVSLDEDLVRRIEWPTTRLSIARLPGDRDVVLVRGLEPNMRWRGFCDEIVGLAQELGVEMVVTLGALLSDSPHTRPVPVSGTASDALTAETLDLQQSRYEGPTGIVGVFQDICARSGWPAASFWAAVPHYVAQPPCPKATWPCCASSRTCSTCRSRSVTSRSRPGRGSAGSTSSRGTTRRWRSTSVPSSSARTRPTCPRPAARPSPASSSATCAAAATTSPEGGFPSRPRVS